MLPPIRLALPLVAVLIAGPLATVTAADGGACAVVPGRPACTILRPDQRGRERVADPAAPECVVYVGGLASPTEAHPVGLRTTDDFFDPLIEAVGSAREGRPLISYRFGYDRAALYPYQTEGAIDPNARSLRSLVRDLGDECFAIDIVAHSMGGVVADRAFSLDLSDRDGVATYLPLASPHNGALAAGALRLGVEIDETYAQVFGSALARTPLHDPRSDAVRDLAHMEAPRRMPRAPTVVRQRMANDLSVLRDDNADRRFDVREYLPGLSELEGHGAIVGNEHVRSVVAAAIRTHGVPAEERSWLEVKAASTASRLFDRYVGGAVSGVGLASGAAGVGAGLLSVAGGDQDLGTLASNLGEHVPEITKMVRKASELKGDPRKAALQAIVESVLDER